MKLTDQEIVKVLKDAKTIYKYKVKPSCMCFCIHQALYKHYTHDIGKLEVVNRNPINYFIPMFTKDFVNAPSLKSMFWWPLNDRKSRIEAFNKLIDYYGRQVKKNNDTGTTNTRHKNANN